MRTMAIMGRGFPAQRRRSYADANDSRAVRKD